MTADGGDGDLGTYPKYNYGSNAASANYGKTYTIEGGGLDGNPGKTDLVPDWDIKWHAGVYPPNAQPSSQNPYPESELQRECKLKCAADPRCTAVEWVKGREDFPVQNNEMLILTCKYHTETITDAVMNWGRYANTLEQDRTRNTVKHCFIKKDAPKKAFSSDKSGYAVFQLPMYSSPQTTYTPPAQNVGFLACNGEGDSLYCKHNGFSSCSCTGGGRRRRLLFGGLSYLRSNCQCI